MREAKVHDLVAMPGAGPICCGCGDLCGAAGASQHVNEEDFMRAEHRRRCVRSLHQEQAEWNREVDGAKRKCAGSVTDSGKLF